MDKEEKNKGLVRGVNIKLPLILAFLLTLLGIGIALIVSTMELTPKEVKSQLEELHNIEVTSINEVTSDSDKDTTTYKVESKSGVSFTVTVETDAKNKKQYLATSNFEQESTRLGVVKKIETILPILKEQGFELYTGGEPTRVEDNPFTDEDESLDKDGKPFKGEAPKVEPIRVGVTDRKELVTQISLLYKDPITYLGITMENETLYNAVKLIRGLELNNPYLDIRGKDGEYISGRITLDDLDSLTSAEDMANRVTKTVEELEVEGKGLPSVTLTDEELKEAGIKPKTDNPTSKETQKESEK